MGLNAVRLEQPNCSGSITTKRSDGKSLDMLISGHALPCRACGKLAPQAHLSISWVTLLAVTGLSALGTKIRHCYLSILSTPIRARVGLYLLPTFDSLEYLKVTLGA